MTYDQATIDAVVAIVERSAANWHETGRQAETSWLLGLSAEIRQLTDPRAGTYLPFPEPAEPSICEPIDKLV